MHVVGNGFCRDYNAVAVLGLGTIATGIAFLSDAFRKKQPTLAFTVSAVLGVTCTAGFVVATAFPK